MEQIARREKGRVRLGEEGFTLIEVMAAFLILSILMLTLITTTISGYRSLRETRLHQQGTAVGNDVLEGIREMSFRSAAHLTTPGVSVHPGIASCGPGQFEVDFRSPSASLGCEELVVRDATAYPDSPGRISAPTQTVSVAGQPFTVRTLVTWVAGNPGSNAAQNPPPPGSQKRVYVEVEWTANGIIRRYTNSTVISEFRRGVPRNRFSFRFDQSQSTTPNTVVTFPHTIENFGPTDIYDLGVLSGTNPRGWTFSFYHDVDNNSTVDVGTDVLLTDTNANGIPDTGSVATGTFPLLIQWTATGGITGGSGITVRFTATSSVTGQIRIVNDQLVVQNTAVTLYLLNRHRPGGPSVAPNGCPTGLTTDPPPPVPTANTRRCGPTMLMVPDANPTDTEYTNGTPLKYSVDGYNPAAGYGGRMLTKSNIAATDTDISKFANWTYQDPGGPFSQAQEYSTGTLTIWVAAKDFVCDKDVTLTVWLRTKAGWDDSAGTIVATGSGEKSEVPAGLPNTCGFQPLVINLNPLVGTTFTIPANSYVELKVRANGGGQNEDGLLLYDWWPGSAAQLSRLSLQ